MPEDDTIQLDERVLDRLIMLTKNLHKYS